MTPRPSSLRSLPAALLAVLAGCLLAPRAASATRGAGPADTLPPDAWNSPRVRELVGSAVEARRHAWSDSALYGFRARARGHVYFLGSLAGLPDAGFTPRESQIVRADQVALRIQWQAPDRWQQTLVGRRGERRLPAGIHYHVDHLTAVLENFGNRIRMGEGTEVRDVLHPLAPGGPERYDYRLADSVGLEVPGRKATLYRVEVRPAEPELAAVVGELHLEKRSRALVRMRITFTPAAYRDPELERITVDLKSALWEGRWWLPAEQTTTIRRTARWLDLPLSSVIRTRLRIFDYRINPDPPVTLGPGHRVLSLPEDRLAGFDDWQEGLYAGLDREDRASPPDEGAIRRRARELVGDRYLAGTSRLAPALPSASELIRARRAEGVLAGAGWRFHLDDVRALELWAGHPFAAGGVEWKAAWRSPAAGGTLELEAYGDRYTDVGPWPGAAGLVSTLGFLIRGEDFTDPYRRTGGGAGLALPVGDARLRLGLRAEAHRSMSAVARPPGDDPVREVRPVARGELAAATLGWRQPLGRAAGTTWSARLQAEGAVDAVGDFGFSRLLARLRGRSGPAGAPWSWSVDGGLGLGGGRLPPQRLLLLGGRGTVPGYAIRRWGGDRAGWLRLEASRELLGPWLSARAIASAGWAELGGPGVDAARRFGGTRGHALSGTPGVVTSAGFGLGLLDGLLRVDLVRGLDGGRWEWMVGADPRLWGLL